MREPESGPLAGYRVLDLTRAVAGPYCSMLLGDYGADVIKLEQPGRGDETRGWGPPFVGNESAYFISINRNKRSLTLDLQAEAGRDILLRLAERADVLLENFRPGTMERLGVGWDRLKQINPRLVYGAISGYGSVGPRRDHPGYDVLVLAFGGLMSITGERHGRPVKAGVAILDVATGMLAHGAVCAALLAREKSGVGQRLELSLLSTQLGMLTSAASNYLLAGEVMERWGSAHPSIVPYQAFAAADGYLVIGAANERFWRKLCVALELDELAEDERFATNPQRVANREVLIPLIEQRLAQGAVQEWLARLEAADVPAVRINDVDQALAEPQVQALDIIRQVEHPTAGTIRVVGPPVGFSDSHADVWRPPPVLGQHTQEVLGELLGVTDERIAELKAAGVI